MEDYKYKIEYAGKCNYYSDETLNNLIQRLYNGLKQCIVKEDYESCSDIQTMIENLKAAKNIETK